MKVVFLDRDGVISEDRPDYITSWQEFEFIPGSLEAIKELSEKGFVPIVITNQSAVDRGLLTRDGLAEIHRKMNDAITSYGGRIKAIYVCPHTPDKGCNCRKPKPGLILQARKDYNLDPANIPMIGDDIKDMVAAREAGCGMAILVRTGKGKEAEKKLREEGIVLDYVADDLLDAVQWLIAHS